MRSRRLLSLLVICCLSVSRRCNTCGVTIDARNRAKVWQHVGGPDHRAKRALLLKCVAGNEPPMQVLEDTPSPCDGLVLSSKAGEKTLMGQLAHLWKEYAAFKCFSTKRTLCGDDTHVVDPLPRQGSWRLRHKSCDMTTRAPAAEDGLRTCSSCLALGNCRHLLRRCRCCAAASCSPLSGYRGRVQVTSKAS